MSDSEDEDFAFYGTPLEPFDEDAVPRKKAITVEDQIATDKHGKRRFHGAFTGGFSAGFFNSVGSLEGWKPSTFKSSRNERSALQQQLPSHFMDDEDTDEFGIAPQVLRTKPEYSSNNKATNKRDRFASLNSGPIPGEPVLKSILKPAKRTMGIILLMKMGWKPGDNIGEKLEKKAKRLSPGKFSGKKVYGCARGPEDPTFSSVATSSDSDDDDVQIYRELGEKAPRYVRKEDNMGLGYKGLDRSALSSGTIKSQKTFTVRDQFNKTIKISGQAFGVGAFEDEDDDVYCTDDKSQYDFSLEPLKTVKKKSKNSLSLTDTDVILGFVKASFKETSKIYPGPIVPASFTGRHVEKVSRFDAAPSDNGRAPTRQRLDANLRAVIIDPEQLPVKVKEEKVDVVEGPGEKNMDSATKGSTSGGDRWQPFAADPFKQERYEKYINLIKIGAKDLVHTVLSNTMSDLERESELREFEGAARLYSGNLMSDRFTHGDGNGDSGDRLNELSRNDSRTKRRITTEWSPHAIVCKRFNIRPPDNVTGATLQSVADSRKKPKFSVFEFLNASKSTNLLDLVESNTAKSSDNSAISDANEVKYEIISGTNIKHGGTSESVATDVQFNTSSSASVAVVDEDEEFNEPADKMDLFKAIFLDSDDENEENKNDGNSPTNETTEVSEVNRVVIAENDNILRNTSPPRGIFANLDLDKLSNRDSVKRSADAMKLSAPPCSIFETKSKTPDDIETTVNEEPETMTENSYGPVLPSQPVNSTKSYINLKLDVNDDRWVEKSDVSEKSSKNKHGKSHKHKRKHKKDKKREKHKKKKKKKYSSSETESESE